MGAPMMTGGYRAGGAYAGAEEQGTAVVQVMVQVVELIAVALVQEGQVLSAVLVECRAEAVAVAVVCPT